MKVKSPKNLLVLILLATAVGFWSNAFWAIKITLETLNPFELTFVRLVVAAALFLPVILVMHPKESRRILREDWLHTLILGLAGIFAYHLLLNVAEDYPITSGTAGLLTGLVPIWTMALGLAFRHEKFSMLWAVGSVISMGGLVLVMFSQTPDKNTTDSMYGILFTIGATWSWGVYTVMCRRLILKKYPPLVIVGWAMVFGALPLPFTVTTEMIPKLQLAPVDFWLSLGFLTICCTFIAYLLWNYALTRLSASQTSTSVYFIPPASMFFGWLFLGEPVGALLIGGAALIIAGVYMASRTKKNI